VVIEAALLLQIQTTVQHKPINSLYYICEV